MDAKKYLQEINRLTDNCNISCYECKLHNRISDNCLKDTEESVDIVEQWSKDCPPKTAFDLFKEAFPNYYRNTDGEWPEICPISIDARYKECCKVGSDDCQECWNRPAIK